MFTENGRNFKDKEKMLSEYVAYDMLGNERPGNFEKKWKVISRFEI